MNNISYQVSGTYTGYEYEYLQSTNGIAELLTNTTVVSKMFAKQNGIAKLLVQHK